MDGLLGLFRVYSDDENEPAPGREAYDHVLPRRELSPLVDESLRFVNACRCAAPKQAALIFRSEDVKGWNGGFRILSRAIFLL